MQDSLLSYSKKFFGQLTTKGLYIILLLYTAYKLGEVPPWAKRVIVGSFAYFLSPIDSIPDLTPVLGMTDDLGVLAFGLVTIACYVTDDIRLLAQEKLRKILKKDIDQSIINQVHSWL